MTTSSCHVRILDAARDAPQLWADTVKGKMLESGFKVRQLHPSAYWKVECGSTVAVHVADVLCVGPMDALGWLSDSLTKQYERKRHMLAPGSTKDVQSALEQGACDKCG